MIVFPFRVMILVCHPYIIHISVEKQQREKQKKPENEENL